MRDRCGEKGAARILNLCLSPQPCLFLPDGGRDSHVDEHRCGERLGGALRDHVWYPLYCEVCHGLQPVHSHIEILCEGANVVHGCHLEDHQRKEGFFHLSCTLTSTMNA